MAIAEDASAPAIVTHVGAPTTVQTASFTPPASSLLVVLVAGGFANAGTTTVAVTDSVSGTYTTAANENASTHVAGVAQVAYRYLSSAPGSMNITATFTNCDGGGYLVVKVLTGAASSQTGATVAANIGQATATTAFTASITTTASNSMVYGVIQDGSTNATITAAANSTLINWFNDSNSNDLVSLASYKSTSATGTPGAITLGCTAGSANSGALAMMEVLPASNTNVTGTDTGSGTDAGHAAPNGTDTGSVADALSTVAGVQLYGTEASSAAVDTAQLTATTAGIETAIGTDNAAVVAQVPDGDTGGLIHGGDFAIASVSVPGAVDTGTGADSATKAVVTVVFGTDAGTGADSSGVGPSGTEAASGSDSATIRATAIDADVVVGVDTGDHVIGVDPKGERTVIVNKESRIQHVPEDR